MALFYVGLSVEHSINVSQGYTRGGLPETLMEWVASEQLLPDRGFDFQPEPETFPHHVATDLKSVKAIDCGSTNEAGELMKLDN